jgi:hypothetical protein
MNRENVALTLVLAMVSAFVGGALASLLISGQPALAEGPKVISAQEFRLRDSKGATRARLFTANDGLITIFELHDLNSKLRMMFMVDGYGNPSAHFWDKRGGGSYRIASTPSISFYDRHSDLRAKVPAGPQIGKVGEVSPVKKVERLQLYTTSVTKSDINIIWSQIDEILITLDKLTGK